MTRKTNGKKKFYDDIIGHLVQYKETILGIKESGCYNYRGRNVSHDWILPEPKGVQMKNYMGRKAIEVANGLHQHLDWHHLNSSQTLCINYFSELIADDYSGLNVIISYYTGKKVQIKSHQFEKVEVFRSSNFDFYCEDIEGHKYYFEIKYTEKDVAKKCEAEDPEKTFGEKYRSIVGNSEYLKYCLDGDNWRDFMFKHYQAYRNIVMANENKGDYCFFITMKDNDGTSKELNAAQNEIHTHYDGELNNLKCLFWDDLLPKTIQLLDNVKLKKYYEGMIAKYLLPKEDK